MNILHISGADIDGGAGKGALWLHLGLLEHGVNSTVITNSLHHVEHKNIIYYRNSIEYHYEDEQSILNKYFDRPNTLFSTGLFGLNIFELDVYKTADLIHLHWINDCMFNIRDIEKIDKPIIWTLRDMWPMTGGCHYSMGCEKYVTKCQNCPQLNSKCDSDISTLIFETKKVFYAKNIHIVGISNWLSTKAKKSNLFKNNPIETIFNAINTKVFYRIDQTVAKQSLGINVNSKIILIGAKDIYDYYKGIDKFIEACKYFDFNKYTLCTFGENGVHLNNQIGFDNFYNFGYIDEKTLCLLYSASDVFVAPSIEEAFGKTIAESSLCGTPVVCFDATGPADIVIHKKTGYKAKPFNAKDLATGIEWILNALNYIDISNNAISFIKNNFDSKIIAKKYIQIYKKYIKTSNTKKQIIKYNINKAIEQYTADSSFIENMRFNKSYNFLHNSLLSKILPDKKYIIYGNGLIGQSIHKFYPQNILFFIDQNSTKTKFLKPTDVLNISVLNNKNIAFDGIIISVLGREESIINNLINYTTFDKIITLSTSQ